VEPEGTIRFWLLTCRDTYSPAAGFSGEDQFTYEISDGTGLLDSAVVTVTVSSAPTVVIEGTNGRDVIDVSASDQPHRILGLGGADRITGSSANDEIIGGLGWDRMNGGGGDDLFIIEGSADGPDDVDGGEGFDTVRSQGGDGTINLNALSAERIEGGGTDTLLGTRWREVWDFSLTELVGIALIDAAEGHDAVTGSSGADTITGGAGDDTLRGGPGDDTFLVEGLNNGLDAVDGDEGFDVILGHGGDDVIGLRSVSVERIDGGGGMDTILGSVSRDVWDFSLIELVGIALIDAAEGHDIVVGSANDDIIKGGPGNDGISGGPGTDTAVFDGVFAGYSVTETAGDYAVVDLVGNEGADNLSEVEILRFADGKVVNGVFVPDDDPLNTPPVATDDGYATPEDTALTTAAPGVLGNDTDGDGDPLTAVLVTGPSNGSLTLGADGSFSYTPNADFNGADGFSYVANDGKVDSAAAQVSLTVAPVDDAPVAQDDSADTREDQSVVPTARPPVSAARISSPTRSRTERDFSTARSSPSPCRRRRCSPRSSSTSSCCFRRTNVPASISIVTRMCGSTPINRRIPKTASSASLERSCRPGAPRLGTRTGAI
jgi:hypothetical protein